MNLTVLTTTELLTIQGGFGSENPQALTILGNVIYTSTPPLNP